MGWEAGEAAAFLVEGTAGMQAQSLKDEEERELKELMQTGRPHQTPGETLWELIQSCSTHGCQHRGCSPDQKGNLIKALFSAFSGCSPVCSRTS